MSTSNLKTEGQKGLNGPWQRNVLKLLAAITTGPLVVTGTFSPSSTQRTWTSEQWDTTTVVTTVAAGSRTVMFETSEDFSGSINGITRLPSRSYTFSVLQNDDTQDAIACVITVGTLNVDTLI